jgi:hypothetical protein
MSKNKKYRIIIEVTDQELQTGLYGSVNDMSKIFDKVLAKAKDQGFKEEMER